MAGLSAHRELATVFGSDDWWHPTGHLRWVDDPVAAEMLHRAVDLLRSWGYDAACWDADRVRRLLEPDVRFPADDTDVALHRDEGWIDGRRLVGHLLDDAVNTGTEVHSGSAVTDIGVKGDHVAEAATDLSGRLHDLAIDVVPALRSAQVIDARVAWRPIPIDGFPSVGGVDDLAGYYEAVTHSGITLCGIIGRVLADEIVDATVDPLVEHYCPERFASVEPDSRRG